jgi:hypothetical protein
MFNLFRCDVKCTFQHSALALNYTYGDTICDSSFLFVTFCASSVPLVTTYTVHTHMLHQSYTVHRNPTCFDLRQLTSLHHNFLFFTKIHRYSTSFCKIISRDQHYRMSVPPGTTAIITFGYSIT